VAEPVLTSGSGGQYSIGPPGGPALVFGAGAGGVYISNTQTDTGSLNTQDTPVVGQDGLQFGVDTLPGMVLTQTGYVYLPGQGAQAMDAYSALAGEWNDPTIRLVPGAIQVFRVKYPFSNVTRRCYGRGRKIMPTYGQVFTGTVPFVSQFQAGDNNWYEDVLSSITLTQAPSFLGGGLTPPATPPLNVVQAVSTQQNVASNTGTISTWPVFVFTGPTSGAMINPGVSFVNTPVSLVYNGSIKPGDTLVVDTRPWAKYGLLNGGSVAGALTGDPMINMQLMPGNTTVKFLGLDYTGTAQLTVQWRSATAAIGGSV
jgi:hypothetical protein